MLAVVGSLYTEVIPTFTWREKSCTKQHTHPHPYTPPPHTMHPHPHNTHPHPHNTHPHTHTLHTPTPRTQTHTPTPKHHDPHPLPPTHTMHPNATYPHTTHPHPPHPHTHYTTLTHNIQWHSTCYKGSNNSAILKLDLTRILCLILIIYVFKMMD